MNYFNSGDKVYTVGDIAWLERENKRLKSLLASKTEIANQLKDNLTAAFERELALKAQVELLRTRLDDFLEDMQLSLELPESDCDVWKSRIKDSLAATPAQCLAEIKAQAVIDAIDAHKNNLMTFDFSTAIRVTDLIKYANQLR